MYTKYLYNCYTLYYVVINYYDKVKTTFTVYLEKNVYYCCYYYCIWISLIY